MSVPVYNTNANFLNQFLPQERQMQENALLKAQVASQPLQQQLMQQKLQQAQLQNQYLPESLQQRNALLGEQVIGAQTNNQFLPKSLQKRIDLLNQQVINAQTNNQYLPESLRQRNALMGQQTLNAQTNNQYLPQSLQQRNDIQQQQLIGAQTNNQYLPQLLQQRNALQQGKIDQIPYDQQLIAQKIMAQKAQEEMARQHGKVYEQQAQYVAPKSEAEINHLNASTDLSGARKNSLLDQMDRRKTELASPIGKVLTDYNNVVSLYGKESPAAQALAMKLNNMAQTSGGINFSMGPDGSANFSTVSQNTGAGGPFPVTSSPANAQPGIVKDPTSGTSHGAAGATFIDPETGKAKSALTTPNITRLQKSVVGAQMVEPALKALGDIYGPLLSYKGQAALKLAQITNPAGLTNNGLPSQSAEASGTAKGIVESMMAAYGYNNTDNTTKMVLDSVEPMKGETRQTYTDRIRRKIKEVVEREELSKKILRAGVDLTAAKSESHPMEFKSKDEFMQYYNALSPDKKAEYKRTHAGQ